LGKTLEAFSLSPKGQLSISPRSVHIDPLFQANDPAWAVGTSVTFEPGSRTAWHTHPLGQTLIVTAGCGLVQRRILIEERREWMMT
jgi:quercetin dioxygenase-like cupin family protein